MTAKTKLFYSTIAVPFSDIAVVLLSSVSNYLQINRSFLQVFDFKWLGHIHIYH